MLDTQLDDRSQVILAIKFDRIKFLVEFIRLFTQLSVTCIGNDGLSMLLAIMNKH